MIDTHGESNINTAVEEHFVSKNRHSSIAVNDKILSIMNLL